MKVQAESVADFVSRYHRPERTRDCTLEYYQNQLNQYGSIACTPYDNVIGKYIVWPIDTDGPDFRRWLVSFSSDDRKTVNRLIVKFCCEFPTMAQDMDWGEIFDLGVEMYGWE